MIRAYLMALSYQAEIPALADTSTPDYGTAPNYDYSDYHASAGCII